MSSHNYFQWVSKYNGSVPFHYGKENCIEIYLKDDSSMRNAAIMAEIADDTWLDCDRPLVTCLKAYFKTQAIASVFHNDVTWAVLLGNERLIHPQNKDGATSLVLTPFFVEKSKLEKFHDYVVSYFRAVATYRHVYVYGNTLMFLDCFQIPYPGGSYFDCKQCDDNWFRICFLKPRDQDIDSRIGAEKCLVTTIPYKTTSVETEFSQFLNLNRPIHIRLPNISYSQTGIVYKRKCLVNPNFVLQDVLHSYGNHYSLGLLLEAPSMFPQKQISSFMPLQSSLQKIKFISQIHMIAFIYIIPCK